MNKKLEQKRKRMLKLIGPEAEHPGKHFKEAQDLILDLVDAGLPADDLMERLYFLTEGYREKDFRPAGERLRSILQCT